MNNNLEHIANRLTDLLSLQHPPLGIAFTERTPSDIAPLNEDAPPPTADGRTGSVPAGCVFWIKAEDGAFSTEAGDHANCSVGSVTHGFKSLDEVQDRSDVAALVGAEWVSPEDFGGLPVIKDKPAAVSYGPLAQLQIRPQVIFLRINGKQAMILSDALPQMRFEGKPQCHIIPLAKEQNEIAVSVGCMLSRVRTGISNNEMTCAIPTARAAEVIAALEKACHADKQVAAYASEDAARFGSYLSSS